MYYNKSNSILEISADNTLKNEVNNRIISVCEQENNLPDSISQLCQSIKLNKQIGKFYLRDHVIEEISKLNNEDEESVNILDDNLIKIKYAATGFMLLKRAALERIKDDVDSFFLPGGNGEPILLHNYWDCKVVDHDYLTEDFHFSYLFNKNGGKIYADKSINLKHIGPHIYGELLKE